MDDYMIRFFATSSFASIARLQLWLAKQGYSVSPAGTNALEAAVDLDSAPLHVTVFDAHHEQARRTILAFIERVGQVLNPNSALVMGSLARSQAVVALDVYQDVERFLVSDVLWGCESMAQGLVQVDGEGFYDNGVLLLKLG